MTKPQKNEISFIAPPPRLSGKPGLRVAECVKAEVTNRGNKNQVVLTLKFENGEIGTMWVEVPSPLTPQCRYMRLVRIALSREVEAGVPIPPQSVFEGRHFLVSVGYRKSLNAKGKGKLSEENAQICKDDGDFLRAHDLVATDDTHLPIDPYGTTCTNNDSDSNKNTSKSETQTQTDTLEDAPF